jgi:predicted dehydrogenase
MARKPENQESTNTSRRGFVKTSAIAAASFMIVPRYVLGGNGYSAPSDHLTIATVGAGGKGQSDIDGFVKKWDSTTNKFIKNDNVDMAFLCDVDDRRAAGTVRRFPKAKVYKDWRELFDKESKNFDAVSVSTPDHMHAVIGMASMQLGKHTWIQKPMAHDIYEARKLTEAAARYKVVTQMGNQGSSGDGVRQLHEWFDAGIIGDVHTVYCFTQRPVWPQAIPWSSEKPPVPKGLDWDLWLGTAPYKDYVDKLIPQAWRGWWDYGTGALGDLGCHLMEAPFRILGLQYATDVQASISTQYTDWDKRGIFLDCPPAASHAILTFPKTPKTKGPVKFHWMDGGMKPERPEELGPTEILGDGDSGILFIGTKGKMMASEYAANPRLLPLSRTQEVKVKQKFDRVPGGADGHYAQWVAGCMAGYENAKVSSPFALAGPIVEALCMANLAIRGAGLPKARANGKGFDYPGSNMTMLWDNANMKITNFDEANKFVKRDYRQPWSLGV